VEPAGPTDNQETPVLLTAVYATVPEDADTLTEELTAVLVPTVPLSVTDVGFTVRL
jgi:hypothetical protein